MEKLENISLVQMIAIFSVSRLMVDYSYMPSVCGLPATQDAWIVDLLAGVFILIFTMPAIFLANKFRNLSIIQYAQKVMGKFFGKTIGVVYVIYLCLLCGAVTLFLVDFLKISVFPKTPLYVLILFVLIPCMYAGFKGVESIARSSVIFAIFVFSVIILFTILNFNNMDFHVLQPVYADTGFVKLAAGVFNVGGRFCDSVIFYMFVPYLVKTASVNKSLYISIIIFTVFYIIISVSTQTVLGVKLAAALNYPYYNCIQQVNVFDFIQRIEFINIIGWFLIFYTKISTTFYAAAVGAAQVFNTKSHKPYLVILNILVFITIIIVPAKNSPLLRIVGESFAYLFALFTAMFIIPTIILIVYFFRRKTLNN